MSTTDTSGGGIPTTRRASPVFTPPISKLEFERLPTNLRMILMGRITPLNKSIEKLLLHSKDDTDFGRNVNNVVLEYIQYYESLISDMNGQDLENLFRITVTSSTTNSSDTNMDSGIDSRSSSCSSNNTQQQTQQQPSLLLLLEQTLYYAVEVIADITKLVTKDQRHMPNILEQYMYLGAYSTVANYIINNGETNIKPSIIKRVMRRCQETASNIESYIDAYQQ